MAAVASFTLAALVSGDGVVAEDSEKGMLRSKNPMTEIKGLAGLGFNNRNLSRGFFLFKFFFNK